MTIPTILQNNNPLVNQNNPLMKQNQRGGRNSLRDSIIQSRIREQETEQRIREREDERIAEINERINEVRNRAFNSNSNESRESIQSQIDALDDMITAIRESRANRENLQAERELERQQLLIEEATQVRELSARQEEEEPETPEEANEMHQRNTIRSLTIIAAAQDRVASMRHNVATMTGEAGQLSRAMSSENSNYVKIGTIWRGGGGRNEMIHAEQAGFGGDDYRNQHLGKLNRGISQTNSAIQSAISTIYRESQQMQQSQLVTNNQNEQDDQNNQNEEENRQSEEYLV
ncbi:MAG: hypothetical protein FWG64_05865 [Firmicutes bacterium]|nr:hypothetical protein [Bacillota bacterium]